MHTKMQFVAHLVADPSRKFYCERPWLKLGREGPKRLTQSRQGAKERREEVPFYMGKKESRRDAKGKRNAKNTRAIVHFSRA